MIKGRNIRQLMDEMHAEFKDMYQSSWYHGMQRADFQNAMITCIKFSSLIDEFKKDPSLFKLHDLQDEQKYILLKANFKDFSKHIDISELQHRFIVMLFLEKPSIRKHVKWDKVTKKDYNNIAQCRPEYFEKYKLPLDRIDATSWRSLINYDDAYLDKFGDNIENIRNKTHLRQLITYIPLIPSKLTVEEFEKSVLDAKDWILFLARTETAKVTAEVQEWLDIQFHMDVLAGGATTTSYTKKARKDKDDVPAKV